jgi:hypothetical protein
LSPFLIAAIEPVFEIHELGVLVSKTCSQFADLGKRGSTAHTPVLGGVSDSLHSAVRGAVFVIEHRPVFCIIPCAGNRSEQAMQFGGLDQPGAAYGVAGRG